MKKINIGILGLGLLFTISCGSSHDHHAEDNTEEVVVNENVVADAESNFKVEGMVCAMGCAAVIQEELGKVNGVAFAEVNFEKELATIKYDSKLVSEADLIAAIENVGDDLYTATKVEGETENLDAEVEETSDVLDVVETVVSH